MELPRPPQMPRMLPKSQMALWRQLLHDVCRALCNETLQRMHAFALSIVREEEVSFMSSQFINGFWNECYVPIHITHRRRLMKDCMNSSPLPSNHCSHPLSFGTEIVIDQCTGSGIVPRFNPPISRYWSSPTALNLSIGTCFWDASEHRTNGVFIFQVSKVSSWTTTRIQIGERCMHCQWRSPGSFYRQEHDIHGAVVALSRVNGEPGTRCGHCRLQLSNSGVGGEEDSRDRSFWHSVPSDSDVSVGVRSTFSQSMLGKVNSSCGKLYFPGGGNGGEEVNHRPNMPKHAIMGV